MYERMNSTGKKLIKIAMIGDIHIDYDYTVGSNIHCGKPLCCTSDSGPAPSPDMAARKWGEYKCDTTIHTLRSLLSYIKMDVQPDAVFWGGDTIPHNIQSASAKSKNKQIMKKATDEIKKGLKGLPIFLTIGNHDTYPQDMFDLNEPEMN